MNTQSLTFLYHDDYKEQLGNVPQEAWDRWDAHKDEYLAKCKRTIDYAVYYYSTRTPMGVDELRSRAYMIFCIACLRWDPNGEAALPTYVGTQLRRLAGTDIRVESKHKDNRTTCGEDGETQLLNLIGKPDDVDTLREYVALAGNDAIALYDKCIEGWYQRSSQAGMRRPITARGLFTSKVLPWTCPKRYEEALDAIKEAAIAWRSGKNYVGRASLLKAAV